MNLNNFLSSEEQKILKDGNNIIAELSKEINKKRRRVPKASFTTLATSALPLFEAAEKLALICRKYKEYYQLLKGVLDHETSTHCFLTECAIELAGYRSHPQKNTLIQESIEPDKKKKLYDIIYEGHFFGPIESGKSGNFIELWIKNKKVLALMDLTLNIDENAVDNFKRYTKEFLRKRDYMKLGWALHFIQDLTAPHHASNKAIFFENLTHGTNTHYPFEKYARSYVWDNKKKLLSAAKKRFQDLKAGFDPSNPHAFALEIHTAALKHANHVDKVDLKKWQEVIAENIPLAIAATAAVLANLAD